MTAFNRIGSGGETDIELIRDRVRLAAGYTDSVVRMIRAEPANLNAWMGLNLVDHRMSWRWGVARG